MSKSEALLKKERELQDKLRGVKVLAERYMVLEEKTHRSVRDMKSYGEDLKEAAEEFLEDGHESDFWKEVSEIKDIQDSIKEATEEHSVVLGNVSRIKGTAD